MDFTILEQQHSQIREKLSALKAAWKAQDYSHCRLQIAILFEALKDHHRTEYENLFSQVWDNPRIREGGPFCTYFFDFFMLNRPLQLVKDRINQRNKSNQKLRRIEIPTEYSKIFSEKSMISIPLEEHIAIDLLTQEIATALQLLDSDANPWITAALDDLDNLISFNIEKEEKCLWALLQQLHSVSAS